MILYRSAYEKLLQWKNQGSQRALCIMGARQTGKTTLIRQFAKEKYECFAELNFSMEPQAKEIFTGSLDAETIITNLTAYLSVPMKPGKTLILLDEIQECPEARTAIKTLVEDGRFDYIESGSLLGVRTKEVRSYPVGFEEIYQMYPMDLEEFLIANGVQKQTLEYLEQCFTEKKPVSQSVHETIMKLFYLYLVVGGMPQVVKIYVDTHDIGRVIENQTAILELYRQDIAKYATNSNKPKIRSIFDAIPSQLNDRSRRFILNSIDVHGRQNRYANSFEWLADAGVALPCYNVTEPKVPLMLNEKRNLFRLYMGDTGLLCAASMERIQFDLLQGRVEINMGSVLENAVAQLLKANGFQLNYYDAKGFGELDFVLQKGIQAVAVEVKSGKDYKKHASLTKALEVKNWALKEGIVFCRGNVEACENLVYYPWYMVMFYRQFEMRDSFIYHVDLSGLEK